MLNATYKMLILHYIMECVGNLCSICLLHEQPKRLIHNFWLHKTITYRIVQLCSGGKYWRIDLPPRIGGEIFGDFGFKSKGTKLVISIGR